MQKQEQDLSVRAGEDQSADGIVMKATMQKAAEIGSERGATRQRHHMGEGGAPMGGNFGVMPLHEANRTGGQMHGGHVPHDGVHLHDSERAGPPMLEQGDGQMAATAHSHHGPHHHGREHRHAPKGTRPHHVGGHKK